MVISINELVSKKWENRRKPENDELRHLPDREAIIYGRVSSKGQIRDSLESIKEIAQLVGLARKDGFKTRLDAGYVENWLSEIQCGLREPGVLKDGEITVDCRDLGLSGTLGQDRRPGLANLKTHLELKELGAIYVSEPSRLSRDQNKIEPYILLKLMKDSNCKIRTPEEIFSPCIERDWDILDEEFQEARDEKKTSNRRLYRKKIQKAKDGKYVGTPICPGFYLPIEERRNDGSFVFGKQARYDPHAQVVSMALEALVHHQNPSLAVKSLKGTTFPFFPPDLKYMESRSALRSCHNTSEGYVITIGLLNGLAQNFALIGTYIYRDIVKENNHESIVDNDLFWEGYRVVSSRKRRGRATYQEPLPFDGLLWCSDHPDIQRISAHNSKCTYVCDGSYRSGKQNTICLDVIHHIVDIPLVTVILDQLDLSVFTDEVLEKLEKEEIAGRLKEFRQKKQRTNLETTLENLKVNLGRTQNTELVSAYEGEILKITSQIKNLNTEQLSEKPVNRSKIKGMRDFLRNIKSTWDTHSNVLKDRFLKSIIEKVILKQRNSNIYATIVWKAGFEQSIIIHRPKLGNCRERKWSQSEDEALRALYQHSPECVILAALPGRSWQSITGRAFRLKIHRKRQYHPPAEWRQWTVDEDKQLANLYMSGVKLPLIVKELKRSRNAIEARASVKRLSRPSSARWKKSRVDWDVHNLKPLEKQTWGTPRTV